MRIDLSEIPLHMRDIVRIGLQYIVSLEQDFENVVLLQHARVDILYLMVGMLNDGLLLGRFIDLILRQINRVKTRRNMSTAPAYLFGMIATFDFVVIHWRYMGVGHLEMP